MKRLLTAALMFFSMHAFSQAHTSSPMKFSHLWNDGTLILATGDTLHCKLRYNRSLDGVVQVLNGDEIVSITTPLIKSFTYFDATRQIDRTYINMTLPAFRSDDRPFLVETLYDDKNFSILCQRTYEMPYEKIELIRFFGKPVPIQKRYILNKASGTLYPLSRAQAVDLLVDKHHAISQFIDDHNIRFKTISDFIEVFSYYRSL